VQVSDALLLGRTTSLFEPAGISLDIEEVVGVPDVLIRDVPEAVLAEVDAHAARLGLSRVEYIRRRLAADAATSSAQVSPADLSKFAATFADLADNEVMDAAWR
jgi:hypothetical protein